MAYNLESSKEDLINHCNVLINAPHQTVHELQLSYCLNLLLMKQQNEFNEKMYTSTNSFNDKLLKTNRSLVVVTWVIAIATIILVFVTKWVVLF